MLENEPEGGERTGSQPAGDTADSTIGTGAGTAATDGTPPQEAASPDGTAAPTRRRTTRRRAAPLSQPELTGERPPRRPAPPRRPPTSHSRPR